jgi:hypothetical protein
MFSRKWSGILVSQFLTNLRKCLNYKKNSFRFLYILRASDPLQLSMKILELSRASRVGEEERLSVCRSSTFRPSSNYAYFTVYLIIAPYIFRQIFNGSIWSPHQSQFPCPLSIRPRLAIPWDECGDYWVYVYSTPKTRWDSWDRDLSHTARFISLYVTYQ